MLFVRVARRRRRFALSAVIVSLACAITTTSAHAGFVVFEAAGANAAAITPSRDAFRAAVGGGTVAGPNGSFGGLRREVNWDGVPDARADPSLLPANFFNTTSPRGVVLSTPGSGLVVSANAGGATPTLFGFPNDFQTFSAQRLFTALNSNITDVNFFLPGTSVAGTTSAFGVIFVDVEVANLTTVEFFDASNNLIFSRDALVGGNQGLTYLGAVADAGEWISRVEIIAGANTIAADGVLGNPNGDVVVMDDFLYAEVRAQAVPEPSSYVLASLGLLGVLGCVSFGHRRGSVSRPAFL
jgi:hypothetical protein